MRYARSHGSAHASLSLDISVAVTTIAHPELISPYTTLVFADMVPCSDFSRQSVRNFAKCGYGFAYHMSRVCVRLSAINVGVCQLNAYTDHADF